MIASEDKQTIAVRICLVKMLSRFMSVEALAKVFNLSERQIKNYRQMIRSMNKEKQPQ